MFRPLVLAFLFAGSSTFASTVNGLSELTLTRFDERSGQNVTADGSTGEVKFIAEAQTEFFNNGTFSVFGETSGGGDWYFRNTGTNTVTFDEGDIQAAVDFDITLDDSLFDGTYDQVGIFFELVVDVITISPTGSFEPKGAGTYSRNFDSTTGKNETKLDLGQIFPPADVVQNDDTRFEATLSTLAFDLAPGEQVNVSCKTTKENILQNN